MSADDDRWWEPRRDGEPTAEFLGRVLDEVPLPEMADRARQFHFDDYFCPPEVDDGANMVRLIVELTDVSRSSTRDARHRIKAMITAVKAGEFDGTKEESDRWAASPDGQATFQEFGHLLKGL